MRTLVALVISLSIFLIALTPTTRGGLEFLLWPDCATIPRVVGSPVPSLDGCPDDPTTVCGWVNNCRSCKSDPTHVAPVPAYVCVKPPPDSPIPTETSTEIGKIKSSPTDLITTLVQILAGIAGGVSVFYMFSGAVKYLFSSGNPEEVEEAKGIITHAISGFLLVFLSVFLLRFIGIDVLHLPGFSTLPGVPGSVVTP